MIHRPLAARITPVGEFSSLDIELHPEPSAPGQARAAIAPLREFVPQEAYDDLRLVVSELVSNSVVHGPGEPIRLRLVVEDNGNIRGQIEDKGKVDLGRNGADGDGGYGLEIVEALTQRWGVYDGSTHVWFELAG